MSQLENQNAHQQPLALIKLDISGMHCANCAANIERTISTLPGVSSCQVSFTSEKLLARIDKTKTSSAELIAKVQGLGFNGVESRPLSSKNVLDEAFEKNEQHEARALWVGIILTLPLFLLSMGRDFNLWGEWAHDNWVNFLLLAFATPVQFYTGWGYYRGAYYSLKSKYANMDVLIALGSSVAYLYSLAMMMDHTGHVYFETAAMIITLVKVGKYLEIRAKSKSNDALNLLARQQPAEALVLKGDTEFLTPIDLVIPGDLLLIKPGATIPVDGQVIEGMSSVDESLISGESLPVEKSPDSKVFAGTLNGQGYLKVQVSAAGEDSFLAKVINLVESAQASRAPIQKLADQVSTVFVPLIVLISLTVFCYWYFNGMGFEFAIKRLVAVLVISCPCALGLATPTVIAVAMGVAARHGILFRSSSALQRAAELTTLMFDKTGTLTHGRLTIDHITWVQHKNMIDIDQKQALTIAASLERYSEHPIAKAIVNKVSSQKIPTDLKVDAFNIEPGYGVIGKIDQIPCLAGNFAMMAKHQVSLGDFAQHSLDENAAKSSIYFAYNGKLVTVFFASDVLKDEAPSIIAKLKNDVEVVMLTGDRQSVAEKIAQKVGISKIIAECLPAKKLEEIQKLQANGKIVGMVGDGVNDAPALTQADLGISLSGASDVARESAGVILLNNDLSQIPQLLSIAKKTLKIIRENLFWAFFYNLILIPIASGIFWSFQHLPNFMRELHPIAAAAAMAVSSLTVVINSLRMRLWNDK